MQLIKLAANKESFRTIIFKDGLNVILAKKYDKENRNLRKTYNGVGKSLIVALVHFCLACNPVDEFEKKIPDWEFSLTFKIKDEIFVSKRNTSKQKEIILNDTKMSIDKFRQFFEQKLFNMNEEIAYLKFRPLISRFIRPRKKSYMSFNQFEFKEKPYHELINNSYLLGLDVNRIIKKYDLKEELDKVIANKNNAEKDEILQQYFMPEGDINIQIFDLQDKINILEKNINEYHIAKDYQQIRDKADALTVHSREIHNQIIVLHNAIENINKSVQMRIDVDKEKILSLYEEANYKMPEQLIKKFSDLERFHGTLIANRLARLLEEKSKLEKAIEIKKKERSDIGEQLDSYLVYLKQHGALEEYTALNTQLADMKNKLKKAKMSQEVLEQYKKKSKEIEIRMKEDNLTTDEYLKEAKPIIAQNLEIFRSFSKEFYEDKAGGIDIINNDGINQIRFDIKATIKDDASDGINEVKIFCFDMTLLCAKHNHNVDMLFHDSRLLSDMEPRQRATLFRLAFETCEKNKIQYIITANEDTVLPIKDLLGDERYYEIISANVRLELTDKSSETKLLGIDVDMHYDDD